MNGVVRVLLQTKPTLSTAILARVKIKSNKDKVPMRDRAQLVRLELILQVDRVTNSTNNTNGTIAHCNRIILDECARERSLPDS